MPPNSVTFVTSFNTGAVYVPEFLETWNSHNGHLPLRIYYDGKWEKGDLPGLAGQTYVFDLEAHGAYTRFRERWDENQEAAGGPWRDYRWDGRRFAPKVFAYTDPARPKTDWWVWIDADAVFKKPMTDPFFRRALPDASIMTWLERPGWGYCEAGWLAFRHQHPAIHFLLARMRELYVKDLLWQYPQWHDAFLLECLVAQYMPGWKHLIQSLSDATMKQLHPWPETILGDYIEHKKGGLKRSKSV